jgi:hypothetical protein
MRREQTIRKQLDYARRIMKDGTFEENWTNEEYLRGCINTLKWVLNE